MTEFQERCLMALDRSPGSSSQALVPHVKSAHIAINSALRGLERQGIVSSFRFGSDRWAALCWGITGHGRNVLREIVNTHKALEGDAE
ncbi:hypothetical protein SAMN05443245_3389 [Paraburkholderia fungorum]|uniref:MarR family transcriptional regulator n=1 Tax=Paraburkholderia fungorum TaxID=134537 RepID=A0A1H1GYY8_9BURK|nr:hypothetical protein [Paraburkholderia fungorum]SDR18371.1 hypothetical protein SAMN05443245_3389 [Paraburkholderia fungorum]